MFSMPVGHSSRRRYVVTRAAFALAAVGWAWSAWCWIDQGAAAGNDAGYAMARTVAITFTIAWVVAAVMPDQTRLYALGFRDGAAFAEDHHGGDAAPVRHLRPVR